MDFLLTLQALRNPVLDALMLFATRLGEELFALVPMLVCYWCLDKDLGLRIGFTYFAGGVANQFIKVIFRVERPFVRNPELVPHPDAVGTATGYSFPSGHTTSATSLASALALRFRKRWWVWLLAVGYVLLVGFSRMYLGVHTPQDVLIGAAMSLAMALIVDVAFRDCQKRPRRAGIYVALCLLLSFAMMAYAGAQVRQDVVPQEQAEDVFKTGGAALGLLLGLILEHRFIRFEVKAPLWAQMLKLAAGFALALACKGGLAHLLGTSLPMQTLRYLITVLVIVAGYPWLFQRALARARA